MQSLGLLHGVARAERERGLLHARHALTFLVRSARSAFTRVVGFVIAARCSIGVAVDLFDLDVFS